MLGNFRAILSILLPFDKFYHHFVVILVHFPHFGMLYQEKSGNPGTRGIHFIYFLTIVSRPLRDTPTELVFFLNVSWAICFSSSGGNDISKSQPRILTLEVPVPS
jgi:hypothetical protein